MIGDIGTVSGGWGRGRKGSFGSNESCGHRWLQRAGAWPQPSAAPWLRLLLLPWLIPARKGQPAATWSVGGHAAPANGDASGELERARSI